uniref:Tripartite motif containing 107 n=1 Tax=Xiphophorus couchianus TaxID=32473 RepID=A0A3B5MVP1_9TELE
MSVSDGASFPADKLTCPICLQLFSEPISLPCGHTYCFLCLKNMEEGLDQHRCPECQAEYQGTTALLKNVKISKFIETYKDTAEKGFAPADLPTGSGFRGTLCNPMQIAEGVLMKEKEWELQVTTSNSQLREKISTLLGQMKDSLQSYSDQVMQMVEKELGPSEESIRARVGQASELAKQLRHTVLTAESLLTEEDEKAFSDELQSLNANIVEVLEKPLREDEDFVETKVNFAYACPKLENMNTVLREQLGEIQRSLRNTFNPSELTFDPETVHPNLILSEDLKTVTFSTVKRSYTSSPQRFTSFYQVLSAQSFSEGEHCWEVELEGSPWIIGMCYSGKLPRSGLPSALESSQSSWCLMWFDNLLTAFEQGHSVPLKKTTVSRRLEVKLSFKTHRLSFYNISPTSGKTHIYTFKANLSEAVHFAYRMMSGHPKGRVTICS